MKVDFLYKNMPPKASHGWSRDPSSIEQSWLYDGLRGCFTTDGRKAIARFHEGDIPYDKPPTQCLDELDDLFLNNIT